jgi:hypothetical protein
VGPGAAAHDADGRRRFMRVALGASERCGWGPSGRMDRRPWRIIIDLIV